MRIIFLADIRGAFDNVGALLTETIADVYILCGNLLDIPFYSENLKHDYFVLQKYFLELRETMDIHDVPLEEYVDTLLHLPDTPDEILEKGNRYLQYSVHARRVMQEKYKVLENILLLKTTAEIYTVPGNHDMDLKYTALHQRNLHLAWHSFKGNKIAGYGGADVWSPGVPEKYILNYDLTRNEVENEMYTFFKAIRPHIIAAYQPAYGYLDTLADGRHCGSKVLRKYCDTFSPQLCLAGNTHRDWGVRFVDDLVLINPGNFGRTVNHTGEVLEGGMFYQIEFINNKVEYIILKKYIDNKIHDIAEYFIKEGEWRETVIDNERFMAKIIAKNYDHDEEKYVAIPEIELFKQIKKFFRMFQTKESEKRVADLEEAVKKINQDIALDVVGSVNVGLSQKNSDVDAVLYIRCGSNCGDMIEKCECCQSVKQQLSAVLHEKYKVDVVDCINLNKVEHSIIIRDYDCDVTQRFVTYRSMCRPINYKLISPIEDILNENREFRRELEGSIRSYLKIFATTSTHVQSFEKYEARLKSIGVKIPDYINKKIKEYLQRPH